ncbi:MAG: hypothetical protein QOG23_1644 [Blastocatellia bacterium]|jgi:hypothetical protein|nr:hypothetical protein [Blastocatellia bacterium]
MPHLEDPLGFDRQPSNQMMLERRWWKSRISPPARRSDLRDIIALGAKLLARKIAGRSIARPSYYFNRELYILVGNAAYMGQKSAESTYVACSWV